MSLDAEGAAGIDLGKASLEVIAGLRSSIDGLATHMKSMRNILKLEQSYQAGAVQVMLRNNGASDSSGDTFSIGLGGPSINRMWEVKRLTVGGVLWTTSVNGTALVVIGSDPHNLTPPLGDIVDEASGTTPALPSIAFYSTRQVVLRHPQRLYVVINNPSVSTTYAVGGEATDYPDTPLSNRHVEVES